MPVRTGKDSKGCFAQWGSSGAKYHYTCGSNSAMNKAKQKAHIQGAAVLKTGYKEQFEPPESGNAPKEVKRILRSAYDSCRSAWVKDNPNDRENSTNKTRCSKIAWGAVRQAGWSKSSKGNWSKKKSEAFTTLGEIAFLNLKKYKKENYKKREKVAKLITSNYNRNLLTRKK